MKRSLLKMADLSKADIDDLLNLAEQLKYERKNGIAHPYLAGDARHDISEVLDAHARVV